MESYFPVFQSTLPQRERPEIMGLKERDTEFQSTLPQRERPSLLNTDASVSLFQSTLPQRERLSNFISKKS